ncbi:MAG TPA: hypothetical protein VEG08_07705, partial [Terriglobales bacterium]|nr:hypothetical protein [Terriglobales bacterium]
MPAVGTRRVLLLTLASLLPASRAPLVAQTAAPPASAPTCSVPAGDILRVMLAGPVNVAKLQPGTRLEGEVMRPVYVVDREAIPAGARVEVIVEKVEKEKVGGGKQGFFEHLGSLTSPAKYGYRIDFRSATFTPPNGAPIPIQISYVQAGEVVRLHTRGEEVQVGGDSAKQMAGMLPGVGRVESIQKGHKQWEQYRHPVLAVQLERAVEVPAAAGGAATAIAALAGPITLPPGTHARLLLLSDLSASGSHQGDTFQARLLEPVRTQEGVLVLPEGSVFDGHISKLVPPRRLSRAGSLHLAFDKITLREGEEQKVVTDKLAASLAATEMDNQSKVKMDEEGTLHGANRTKKQFMEDLGLGLGMQQVVDEAAEMA